MWEEQGCGLEGWLWLYKARTWAPVKGVASPHRGNTTI